MKKTMAQPRALPPLSRMDFHRLRAGGRRVRPSRRLLEDIEGSADVASPFDLLWQHQVLLVQAPPALEWALCVTTMVEIEQSRVAMLAQVRRMLIARLREAVAAHAANPEEGAKKVLQEITVALESFPFIDKKVFWRELFFDAVYSVETGSPVHEVDDAQRRGFLLELVSQTLVVQHRYVRVSFAGQENIALMAEDYAECFFRRYGRDLMVGDQAERDFVLSEMRSFLMHLCSDLSRREMQQFIDAFYVKINDESKDSGLGWTLSCELQDACSVKHLSGLTVATSEWLSARERYRKAMLDIDAALLNWVRPFQIDCRIDEQVAGVQAHWAKSNLIIEEIVALLTPYSRVIHKLQLPELYMSAIYPFCAASLRELGNLYNVDLGRAQSINERLAFQDKLLKQLDPLGELGLAERSLKSQLDRLVDKIISHYGGAGRPILGLAAFDWDATQHHPPSRVGDDGQCNLMPHAQWARLFRELSAQGVLPIRLTTRAPFCSETDDVHTAPDLSALFGDVFSGGVLMKAESLAYVDERLVEAGIMLKGMTLLDDQVNEVETGACIEELGLAPILSVQVAYAPGGCETLEAAKVSYGCLAAICKEWRELATPSELGDSHAGDDVSSALPEQDEEARGELLRLMQTEASAGSSVIVVPSPLRRFSVYDLPELPLREGEPASAASSEMTM